MERQKETYKITLILIGFIISIGLLISNDITWAQSGEIATSIIDCAGAACGGGPSSEKNLSGFGSIDAQVSRTDPSRGWTGQAGASASIASLGNGIQITATAEGQINAGGEPCCTLMAKGRSYGDASFRTQISKPGLVTVEIGVNYLLERTNQANAVHLELNVTTQDSQGRSIKLISHNIICDFPSCQQITQNNTFRRELGMVPGQMIKVTASTQGSASRVARFSSNATISVHIIEEGQNLNLNKVSGDGQEGPIGTTLPKPLVVKVTDGSGNPVSGKSVNWAITGPDGALGRKVSQASSTAGDDGKASATLTLGDLPGKYIVKATCPDCSSGSPVTFTATATSEACTQNGASIGSQVGFLSGNLFYTQNLLSLSGSGPNTNLTLAYNSVDNTDTSLGLHWTHNYAMKIERDSDGFITLKEEDGKRIVFVEQAADIFLPIDHFGRAGTTIERLQDGRYQLRRKDGTVYIFDATGRLIKIHDRNLNTLSLVYQGDDLVQLIDPSGRTTSLGYDGQGRLISLTDPAGRITTLGYSPAGYLSLIKNPNDKSTFFTYDGTGLMLSRTDPDGNEVSYSYDGEGRLISATDASGTPNQVTYQPEQNQAIITDRDGGQTTYLYDPILDKPLLTIAPDGGMTSNTYDTKGNLISTIDPAGNTTSYTYDDRGNLITITNSQGGITRYAYDPIFNQVTSITDPNGNITSYTYDGLGNLLTVTDPTGGVTTYSYDAKGRLIRIINSLGQATTFTYDAPGNLISITDPAGATTTMSYDQAGNMISRTDPNGATTLFEYDALNRLIKTIDPLGNATTFTYDARGNRISQTDAIGRTTRYEYNYQNRLIRVIDPQGGVTSYTYDAKGNLTSISDANGQTTSYVYDTLNRLISEADPLGNTIRYAYDQKGNLISKTDAEGQVITFTYDSLNRLTRKSYPDSGFDAFTYGSNGRIISASNQYISYTLSYDAAGRITQATDSRGHKVGYKYDLAGNRTGLTYPDGGSVSYSYDSANRLSGMTDWSGRNTSFGYDNTGRRIGLNLPNGTKASYSYDQAGRLTDLSHKTGSGSILDSFSYTYDPIGNRLSVTRPEEKLSYTYDLLDRLVGATPTKLKGKDKEQDHKTEEFTYDLAGNRITGPKDKDHYTYNAGNQLVSDRKHQYQYDRNGNLIKKIEVDDDGDEETWAYSYDLENRLIKVTKQEEDEIKTITFKYDPFGRRIEKKATETPSPLAGEGGGEGETKTHTYVYDNEDIITEFLTKAEGGKTKTETTKYLHGPGIDEPLEIERKGETYYYHTDGLGSITALTDSRQKTMESYTYTSFGDLKRQGDKVKNTYTFTGREWDEEIDLYYYRARYYDAEAGRFLTNDPILSGIPLISGNRGRSNSSDKRNPLVQTKLLHPYIYALNDPINKTDPSGLAPCNQCCDCPSGTWLIDQGGTGSISLIFGFSKTRIEFRCSGNNKKCSGVLNCSSIGLQADISFQWNIDFYTIGTGSIVRNACNFSDILSYTSSGWIISAGPFSTGGGEVGIGAGPGIGAGVAYQWCTAGDMVCQ